jgi:hypothetical protein
VLGCAVWEVAPDAILPHMIVTLERARAWLAAAAVATAAGESAPDLEAILQFEKVPLCSFVLPKSDRKDIFGFSEEEWRRVFKESPGKHRIVLDLEGKLQFPGQNLELESADRCSDDLVRKKWTMLSLCVIGPGERNSSSSVILVRSSIHEVPHKKSTVYRCRESFPRERFRI